MIITTRTADAASVRLKIADDAAITMNVRYSLTVTPDADGWAKHSFAATTSGYYQVEMTNPTGDIALDPQVGEFWVPPPAGDQQASHSRQPPAPRATFPTQS